MNYLLLYSIVFTAVYTKLYEDLFVPAKELMMCDKMFGRVFEPIYK